MKKTLLPIVIIFAVSHISPKYLAAKSEFGLLVGNFGYSELSDTDTLYQVGVVQFYDDISKVKTDYDFTFHFGMVLGLNVMILDSVNQAYIIETIQFGIRSSSVFLSYIEPYVTLTGDISAEIPTNNDREYYGFYFSLETGVQMLFSRNYQAKLGLTYRNPIASKVFSHEHFIFTFGVVFVM